MTIDNCIVHEEDVGEYSIRVEEYKDYIACTVWGPFTPQDVVNIGDSVYGRFTILRKLPPHSFYWPTIWFLMRNFISSDQEFIRLGSLKADYPDMTIDLYRFGGDGREEVGFVGSKSNFEAIKCSFSNVLGEVPIQLEESI